MKTHFLIRSGQDKAISVDGQGDIWVATDRGLNRITGFEAKGNSFKVQQLDATHGLPSDDINAIVSVPDEGRLMLATDGGLVEIDHEIFGMLGENSPLARIVELEVNGKERPVDGPVELEHWENDIRIRFSGRSYASQGKMAYAIQLEGREATADTLGERVIEYRNLEPGSYRFLVRVRDHNGNWSAEPARLEFLIRPHFTQTLWFPVLLACLLIALVVIFLQIRLRAIRKKEKVQAEYRMRLIELERSALQAQMNPHFISNVLGSVQAFILGNDADPLLAADYLADFSRLIRMMLEHSRSTWINLREELEFLELYLSMEKLRLGEKLDYRIVTETGFNSGNWRVPAMLVQPFVENAVQHGVRHLESGGLVEVRVGAKGAVLRIEVEDNGIGRKAASEFAKSERRQSSHGTKISRERVEAINAAGEAKIDIEIRDKENKGEKGTIVIISIEKNA